MDQHSSRTLPALLVIASLNFASANPIQWPGNGHFYEVVAVPATISWDAANAAATAAGGYLATITSQAENDFVFTLANASFWHGYSGPWLGGYQFPATSQPNANWRWVTEEAWGYTNWQAGQPNHSGGKVENKLQFGFGTVAPVWNDIMSIDPNPANRPTAYVLEYDKDPSAKNLEIRCSQVELCWPTAANTYYQVLVSSAVTANEWVPLSTSWVTGDGARHCETVAILPGNPTQFYRLLSTNAPPVNP